MEEPPINPYAASQLGNFTIPVPPKFAGVLTAWTICTAFLGSATGVLLMELTGPWLVRQRIDRDVVASCWLMGMTGLGAGVGWAIGRRKTRRLRERWCALHAERQELAEQLAARLQKSKPE